MAGDAGIDFRKATSADVAAIIEMLADDELGRKREDVSLPLNQAYIDAFAAIDTDPNQLLSVVEKNVLIFTKN